MSLSFPCDLMVSHAGQSPLVNAQVFLAFLAFYPALRKQSDKLLHILLMDQTSGSRGLYGRRWYTGLSSPLIQDKLAH